MSIDIGEKFDLAPEEVMLCFVATAHMIGPQYLVGNQLHMLDTQQVKFRRVCLA